MARRRDRKEEKQRENSCSKCEIMEIWFKRIEKGERSMNDVADLFLNP